MAERLKLEGSGAQGRSSARRSLKLFWRDRSGEFSGCTVQGHSNGGCLSVRLEVGQHGPQIEVGHPSSE